MSAARSALVTGAGGFLGANLVRRLLVGGLRVCALVRPGGSTWRLDELGRDVDLRKLDLLDGEGTRRVLDEVRPDWVFHLAAHGAYSWQADPRRVVEVNAVGTSTLLGACAAVGCETLVHAGTSSEYGFKDHAPREDEPLEPNSPYAASKACATHLCSQLARDGALNAVTLRLYSVYGPWEDSRRLFPALIVRGLRGELPPLVDPASAHDYVAAEDAVEAFVAAATHAAELPAGGVYNVGSGRQTTVEQVVELSRRLLGVGAEPQWGSLPGRGWDTPTWVADPRRAQADLGWTPRRSLEEGFAAMVEWLRSNPMAREVYGVDG